jgi:hypothetical protein
MHECRRKSNLAWQITWQPRRRARVRSESEVYSDADADFSDNGLSPGIKQIFQQEWDNFKQRYFEFNKH